MDFQIWIAFIFASIVLLIIPGPTILMVASYVLSRGKGVLLFAILGVALGDLIAMSFALMGVGVLLATSSLLFSIIKWLGALYLIYLGLKLFRAPRLDLSISHESGDDNNKKLNARKAFSDCFFQPFLIRKV